MVLDNSISPPVVTGTRRRLAFADNLKVVLVVGVVVGHTTMAWTGLGVWVFDEPHVREPLLSILVLLGVIGAFFAMPLFFLIAGAFTPASLQHKGLRRFLIDRLLRLGLPMLFFIVFLSPIIEYVDPDNAGWARGFGPFIPHIWWPPVPGPTWFLGVLLLFSAGYAIIRTVLPRRTADSSPLRIGHLVLAALAVALTSYVVRLAVPMGTEVWQLALGQAPGWVAGFALGVIGAERGWFGQVGGRLGRRTRDAAWVGVVGCVLFIGGAAATGADIETYAGGGTWQSLVTAGLESVLVVAMSLWLIDLFARRFDHQGRVAGAMSRVAYAAFVVHQLILVGLVLVSRHTPWAPEVEFFAVASLGVIGSFVVGSLVMRIPGVSRIV
jgi:glucan biosynthesis protein C